MQDANRLATPKEGDKYGLRNKEQGGRINLDSIRLLLLPRPAHAHDHTSGFGAEAYFLTVEGAHDHFPAGGASPFLFPLRMRTSVAEQRAPLLPPSRQRLRPNGAAKEALARPNKNRHRPPTPHSYLSKKRSLSLIFPSLPQIKPGKKKKTKREQKKKNPQPKLRRSHSHTARIGPLI